MFKIPCTRNLALAAAVAAALAGMRGQGNTAYGQLVPTNNTATATSLNVATLTTGTVLQVTPAVSADRRYVGMAIDSSFSSLQGFDTFVVPNGTTAGVTGVQQAVGIHAMAFRPAQIGKVICVDNDPALLTRHVAPLAAKNVSLKTIVRTLSDKTGENIVLGVRGLEQAGVDLNAPHDFTLPDGSVKEALLEIIRIGAGEPDMVITAEDKVIQVSTQAQADNVLVTKTYYLEDLLNNLPRIIEGGTDLNNLGKPKAANESEIKIDGDSTDLSKPVPLSSVPSAKAAAKITKPAHAAAPTPRPGQDSTNILEVITNSVRPEIWRNHGGKAEIFLVNDKVTVKAPASVLAILDGPKVYNPNKQPLYIQYSQ